VPAFSAWPAAVRRPAPPATLALPPALNQHFAWTTKCRPINGLRIRRRLVAGKLMGVVDGGEPASNRRWFYAAFGLGSEESRDCLGLRGQGRHTFPLAPGMEQCKI
jgi:hypothetical protein